MEWHYDNSSAKVPNNIWEMGAKRFMAQPGFALAYIDFQLGLGDTANARATFERALTVTPAEEAQPLWDGYLKFEVQVPEVPAVVESCRTVWYLHQVLWILLYILVQTKHWNICMSQMGQSPF